MCTYSLIYILYVYPFDCKAIVGSWKVLTVNQVKQNSWTAVVTPTAVQNPSEIHFCLNLDIIQTSLKIVIFSPYPS